MENRIIALRNTLEGMCAEAEEKGRSSIAPNLSLEDVEEILDALTGRQAPALSAKEAPGSELKATIGMMTSPDYKERFKAEYYQLLIRQNKLINMLAKYKAGTLNFVPKCSFELLREQAKAMGNYALLLKARAEVEGIDLTTL